MRSMSKSLLYALLSPNAMLKELQDTNQLTKVMAIQEEVKTLPFGDVWNYFCEECGIPSDWFAEIEMYKKEVLANR